MNCWTTAEALYLLLRNDLDLLESTGSSLEGERASGQALALKLRRICSLKDPSSPRRIAVFGAPKRGKSTLINALLHVQLMPVARDFLTSCVVRSYRDVSLKDRFKVVVRFQNGYQQFQILDTPEQASALIERCGTRRGEELADWIEVASEFPEAELLHENGNLIDTPGAELAFEHAAPFLEQETHRALEILDSVHIALFAVRADQIGAQSDALFYRRELCRRNPLNLVNFMDRYEEEDLELHAIKTYGFEADRVLCISAKQAWQGCQTQDRTLYCASGFPRLTRRILEEMRLLGGAWALRRIMEEFICFRKGGNFRPLSRVFLNNLRSAATREFPDGELQTVLDELENS